MCNSVIIMMIQKVGLDMFAFDILHLHCKGTCTHLVTSVVVQYIFIEWNVQVSYSRSSMHDVLYQYSSTGGRQQL